jgi:hypothetical protein
MQKFALQGEFRRLNQLCRVLQRALLFCDVTLLRSALPDEGAQDVGCVELHKQCADLLILSVDPTFVPVFL